MKLSASQKRDLKMVREGLSRGESYQTCESLVRLGLLTGDWITGYHARDAIAGLENDATYWDLRRTYGDNSPEVAAYLRRCAAIQARGENHT